MTVHGANLAESVSHISLMHRPFGAPRIHMDESASGGSPASEPVSVPLAADAPEAMSLSDAVRSFADDRRKLADPQAAESANPEKDSPVATAENPELAPEADNVAPPEEDPDANEPEAIDPEAEALPPIEPPRSWTKERKEQFNALPRELQQYVADRAQEQDREFRTRQNEVAEKTKAIEAKVQAAEQAKQQYETGIQSALRALEREQLREFSDIKTWDDVKKMQAADPLRYQAWDLHQKELAMFTQKAKEVQEQNEREFADRWAQHVQAEDKLAREYIPELSDKEKGPALVKRAEERLYELGFKAEELAQLASGKASISLHDHRLQRLIYSDLKLAEIQKAKSAVVAKPVPPVQRPGTPRGGSQTTTQQIQALERQLSTASGNRAIQISAQIHQLERKAAAARR